MAAARTKLGEESGFTLVELLLVAVLGLVVLTAGYGLLQTTARGQVTQSEQAAQTQQARAMVERITREVRQGSGVVSATGSSLALVTWVKSSSCGGTPGAGSSIECRVTYQCSSGACTREETDPGVAASGGSTLVVDGLSPAPVFTYTPSAGDPTYIEVKLEFQDSGEETVSIEGGVALRNSVVG